MVRQKRIIKKIDPLTGKPIAGGTPSFEFVDTETGEVFPSAEATRTKGEFQQARELPQPQRKEELIGFQRERLGLGQTPLERVRKDPEAFGLEVPTQPQVQPQQVPGQEVLHPLTQEQVLQQQLQPQLTDEQILEQPGVIDILSAGFEAKTREEKIQAIKDAAPIVAGAGAVAGAGVGALLAAPAISSAVIGWRLVIPALTKPKVSATILEKGKLIINPKQAVQFGTALKNKIAAASLTEKLVLAYGGFKAGENILGFFDRKVDDQQQALNTVGTITSTIVGDSTSSAGDFKAGLRELDNIEQQLIQLESDIKLGTIRERKLAFDGRLFDINADVQDQLATIDEGRRDIRSFALAGNFPELSDFEIQTLLRQLEDEGFIEPVDLTKARRETSKS